jgi:methionyl-tRNA synthetase
MKPSIDIERFRKLDLRVGTITAVRRHPLIPDLVLLTVLLEQPADVLAPAALAADKAPGDRVVVAAGLYPLTARGLRFTHCLMPVRTPGGATVSPTVIAEIADGRRLA